VRHTGKALNELFGLRPHHLTGIAGARLLEMAASRV
jgi:hypothetical protein